MKHYIVTQTIMRRVQAKNAHHAIMLANLLYGDLHDKQIDASPDIYHIDYVESDYTNEDSLRETNF